MRQGYEFAASSGRNRNDCHWLGYRYDEVHGFSPRQGESWVAQSKDGESYALMSQRGWMTGLWRTDSRVWVTESSGRVYMNPSFEPRAAPWQTFELGATLLGVWGLRDDLVFAWGIRRGTPVAFVYRGKEWKEVPTPGQVGAVHGPDEDLIYAVGLRGLITRWDGAAFEAVEGPVEDNLADVYVESEDRMYACGPDGHLLTGTVDGWEVVSRYDGMLHCVARWGDTVWVGAGEGGLLRLVDRRLELYKPKVLAEHFDTRGDLLVTAPNAVIDSSDGSNFRGILVEALERLSVHQPPSWKP